MEDQITKNTVDDFINLENVLEYVLELIDVLRKIQLLLKDDSVLRINVPNYYSAFQGMLLKQGVTEDAWFAPTEYSHYFTLDCIRVFWILQVLQSGL